MEKNIGEAAKILKAGGLAAIPTETVYGLAADAFNENAVTRIYTVKGRPSNNPLIVHTPSAQKAFILAREIPDEAYKLAAQFWPGPLTVVLPRRDVFPAVVSGGLDTIALRVPAHPTALALLKAISFPLCAPSANPSGYISPTSAQHVDESLGNRIPYILDGGSCKIGLESTIIGFPNGTPTLLRPGVISVAMIESVIGPVAHHLNKGGNPLSSGQLASHYSPKTPFMLASYEEQVLLAQNEVNAGFITYSSALRGTRYHWVLQPDKIHPAAQRLYAIMREADDAGLTAIYCEPAPDNSIGAAINDRLRRAAHPH